MAYVTVPKDLTKVKSKVVFGLTKRQLICFGGALLVGVPLFFLIRGRVPTSAAALIMVFAMLPGFLLALYEKHGQPLEVVVRQIVECCFIQPKERPYGGMFAAGNMTLANFYPITASLGMVGYRSYDAAVNWNIGTCSCSLVLAVVISAILILCMNEREATQTKKKTKKAAPKKGW